MTKQIAEQAEKIVDEAGQAGGLDEVLALAERGWPTHRGLDDDSPELRAAIQDRAKDVISGVVRGPARGRTE